MFSKLQRQVNLICWASNIHAPVMQIDGILLIHIDLEELVVALALEVFVADLMSDPLLSVWASGFTYEFNFWKLA